MKKNNVPGLENYWLLLLKVYSMSWYFNSVIVEESSMGQTSFMNGRNSFYECEEIKNPQRDELLSWMLWILNEMNSFNEEIKNPLLEKDHYIIIQIL